MGTFGSRAPVPGQARRRPGSSSREPLAERAAPRPVHTHRRLTNEVNHYGMATAHIAAARRRVHEAAQVLTVSVAAVVAFVAAMPVLLRLADRQPGRARRGPAQEPPPHSPSPGEPCADCPRRTRRSGRTDPDAGPAPGTPGHTGEQVAATTEVGVLAYVVDGERTYPV